MQAAKLAVFLLSGLLAVIGTPVGAFESDRGAVAEKIDQLATGGQDAGAGNPSSIDQNPALSAPVLGGSFPRSILIPGTDTSIRISGRLSETAVYLMSGGVPNGTPNTGLGTNGLVQSIPLRNTTASARGDGIFLQSPRATRVYVETRTPTSLGEARTVLAWDWAGSNSYVPGGTAPQAVSNDLAARLLYAYGTLGGVLAGQATSNFSDLDADGETLEFGGNVGEPGRVRAEQLRYTTSAWWTSSLSASVENSETNIATPVGIEANDAGIIPTATTSCSPGAPGSSSAPSVSTCNTTLLTGGSTPLNPAKATAPDFTVAWYLPEPWGHVSLSGLLRPGIAVSDGKFFAKHYVGYGGHLGADLKPGWFGWDKDHFTLHFTAGDMIGGYLNSSSNFDLATNYGAPSTVSLAGTYGGFSGPTSAASAAAISFKPTQEMGAEFGYQHWWLDNLRSNFNAGFNAHYGIPIALVNATGLGKIASASGGQAVSLNKELLTAHVNLIWNPVSFVDIGIEYIWGQRTVLNNQTATLNALINRVRVTF